MKKFFTLSLIAGSLALGAQANLTTDGTGKVYTFQSLSAIDTSGVIAVDGTYIVNKDFTIAAGDTLRLQNNDVVKFGTTVRVYISGVADFAPADTAYLTQDEGVTDAKGFTIWGENSTATLRNVTFDGIGISFSAKNASLYASNCTFQNHNGKLTGSGAIAFSGTTAGNIVENCYFLNNSASAIGSGANVTAGVIFRNNYVYHNTTANLNKPQVNLTVINGTHVEIVGNTVIGDPTKNMVGGISVSNMLGAGAGTAIVKDNIVRDNRYGITALGAIDITIDGNQIIDNKYETNPNNGGSGISIYNNPQSTKIRNNNIEGNLWGITLISLGKGQTNNVDLGTEQDPGNNTFKNNSNGGVKYDLYNNTANPVYAIGNTWDVEVQDSIHIEAVITHKADNPALGQVYFLSGKASVADVLASNGVVRYNPAAQAVVAAEPQLITIYDLQGRALLHGHTSELSVATLAEGIYLAATPRGTVKFIKR